MRCNFTRLRRAFFTGPRKMGRTKLKRIIVAAGILVSAMSVAGAADLPMKAPAPMLSPVPVSNWTAAYVGGFVGGSWGNGNVCHFGVAAYTCADLKASGFFGGAYVGYDYELPNRVVVGARISVPLGSFGNTDAPPAGFGPVGTTVKTTFNWAVTADVRFGYDMGQWMPYAGAGLAFANAKFTLNAPGLISTSATESQAGLNLFAGVKYAFARNWAAGLQYTHTQFQRQNYNFTGPFVGAAPI